jgi:MFS family permease
MTAGRNDQLFSKYQILSLYLPSILLSLGTSMVAPVLPVFAKTFDVGFSEASMVFVIAQVGQLAATFPAGYLMDSVGRRPVLLAGPLLTAVSSFMTPFSGSFTELLVWRFVGGAATQLWMQARLVVIADTASANTRARQISWMNGTARGGQLIGPSVGGLLAASLGVSVPFVLHAAITLLATLPSVMLVKETAPGRQTDSSGAAVPAAAEVGWGRILAAMFTVQMMVFLFVQFSANMARGGNDFGSLNLYAVYAYGVNATQLGLLNSVAALVGLPVPFIAGYLMDRYGRRSVIVPGFAFYGTSVALMALTGFFGLSFEAFALGYLLVQFSQGTIGGTMQVLGTDMAPAFARGRFFAIWRLIAQFGSTITPGVFALLAERVSYGVAFVYLAVCAYLVALLVGTVLRVRGGSRSQENAAAS